MKYFIKTFGCQANVADSERVASFYEARGFTPAVDIDDADTVIINTCVVRQKAEDKVYSLVHDLAEKKKVNKNLKIIITGCLVGTANREPTGRVKKYLRDRLPGVDEFLPIEEVGFDHQPLRQDKTKALVPISNGCNNLCTFCVVPYSRGREVSRPFADIIHEVEHLSQQGYKEITLLGQNVNSYGADILQPLVAEGKKTGKEFAYELPGGKTVVPVMVKHLGRVRIPTLFPYLLEEAAKTKGLEKINFISSNPWDFSDELIEVISKYDNINREIHLPVQSGDNKVLKNMNRWYTREEYLDLIQKIRAKVPTAEFTTDIIVGFPGESEEQFKQTVDLCRQVKFNIAYISGYSPRPGTRGEQLADAIPWAEKKRRFHLLDELINKSQIGATVKNRRTSGYSNSALHLAD
ncbi:MAG: MiaB/RimO family radical SAM methylthiotransferase [bacterium]|nr:MiaB/RimO family radical SAM methylthiotransferase [bacterium]